MSKIIKDVVANGAPPRNLADSGYRNLFAENGSYVFDGNRVTAHFRVARNGVGRWRLHTIDANLSLVVTPDLRIRKYRRTERTCVVRIIRLVEKVFDALKPLDEAMRDCAKYGHAWSPIEHDSNGVGTPYTWQWCVLCGAKQVWFPETCEWLECPEGAVATAEQTSGALPTLHGPVVGGAL